MSLNPERPWPNTNGQNIQGQLQCFWPYLSFSVFCCSPWCSPSIFSTWSLATSPFPFPFCHKVKSREVPLLLSVRKGRKGSKCHKIQNGHGPTQMAKYTGTVAVFLAISVVFRFLLFSVVLPLYIPKVVSGHCQNLLFVYLSLLP